MAERVGFAPSPRSRSIVRLRLRRLSRRGLRTCLTAGPLNGPFSSHPRHKSKKSIPVIRNRVHSLLWRRGWDSLRRRAAVPSYACGCGDYHAGAYEPA